MKMTQACFLEVIGELKLLELSHWSSRYYMTGSKNKKDVSHTCMIIASWGDPGFFNAGCLNQSATKLHVNIYFIVKVLNPGVISKVG